MGLVRGGASSCRVPRRGLSRARRRARPARLAGKAPARIAPAGPSQALAMACGRAIRPHRRRRVMAKGIARALACVGAAVRQRGSWPVGRAARRLHSAHAKRVSENIELRGLRAHACARARQERVQDQQARGGQCDHGARDRAAKGQWRASVGGRSPIAWAHCKRNAAFRKHLTVSAAAGCIEIAPPGHQLCRAPLGRAMPNAGPRAAARPCRTGLRPVGKIVSLLLQAGWSGRGATKGNAKGRGYRHELTHQRYRT